MTAFIRRYRNLPTTAQLLAIEQIAIVDGVPTTPVTGAGAGTLLLIGEFEDGPFNEPTEVFGEDDERVKFGGFGFTYGQTLYENPCARVHIGEPWNGNAFLKGKFLKPPRKICVRVDSSVGSVRFQPLASVRSNVGPFILAVGQQLTVAPDGGAGVTTVAINATAATDAGIAFPGGGNLSLFVGGEQIGITIDNNPEVIVTFQAGDQTAAQVAARINGFLGYNAVTTILAGTAIQIAGIVLGTSGKVILRNVSGTPLTNIGQAPGTVNGTGNVANVNAVTATEVAALIDALAGINALVDSTGAVVVYSPTVGTGSVNVTAGAMATALGLASGLVSALIGAATSIPAGTRVRTAGGLEWVSMQTLAIPEGTSGAPNLAFYASPIRPALDNGTAVGTAAGTITTLVDIPSGRMFSVTNIDNVSAALDENTMDARYQTAFNATVDPSEVSAQANYTLCARRSDAVTAMGLANAITASDEGCFGRSFHSREPFGRLGADAITAVATNRGDRNFHTWPAWYARIPEIATRGVAGGSGFTADGVILIGADGPLAYINAVLNPEENPGQDVGNLLDFIVGIEKPAGTVFNRQLYEALKRAGICAPRIDQRGVKCYQSEVTTSLEDGRTTQKRRKMADHLQDTFAIILLPFSKKLATEAREAAIDARLNSFLRGYRSADAPDAQRIAAYLVTNTTSQNPDLQVRGVSSRKIQVQLLPSLDTFFVNTEIGEGQIVVSVE